MCFFPTEASQTMRTGAMHGTRRKPTIAVRKLGEAVHSYLAKLNETDANLMQTWCDSRCDALCHDTMDIDGPHSDSPWQSCPEARVSRISQIWVPWLVLDMEEWFLEDRTKKCIETSDVLEYHLSLFIIEYLECIQNWRSMQQRNNRLIRLLKVQLPFRLLQLVLRMVNSQEVLVLRP